MFYFWKILDIINNSKNRLIAKSRKTAYFYLLINLPNIINIMLKGKSLTFFTLVNPGIEYGGLLGYSKTKINKRFNKKYIANSITFDANDKVQDILDLLSKSNLTFPFIIKPDIGERSKGVKYIDTYNRLIEYLKSMKGNLIIEEYIEKREEYGILYTRLPHTSTGTITSFALKSFNINKSPSEINFSKLNKKTRYINLNAYITKDLVKRFDQISKDVEGFYFGRFDVKANNINDLINGDFKIIELNGIGSVPLHLYDPHNSLQYCYKFYKEHYNIALQIAKTNRYEEGNVPMRPSLLLKAALGTYIKINKYYS